jgi:uncharacterized protein YhaN
VRIAEIRIDGYGVLADVNIGEFPQGLTVISGENEAGKSTLLDFVRGMLFGFPGRNRRLSYHPPLRGGRHGGALELVDDAGARWHIERFVGGGDVSVAAQDGSVADAGVLQRILGNADDALFRNVFAFGLSELSLFESLDRDEVRDIVFSAGVLGAGRSARRASSELDGLRTALVRPRKGDAPANALTRRIGEIDTELRSARRRAESYPAMLAQQRLHQERVDVARQAMDDGREREREIDLLLSLWPTWRSRLDAEAKLAGLGPVDARPTAIIDRSADIHSLSEARSGHLERLAKHLEHLGSIASAESESDAIATRLGHKPMGSVPLAITEELARLRREAPDAQAALRGADDTLRKAATAEQSARGVLEELSQGRVPLERGQIERRLALVQRLETTVARERLLSERVSAQRNEAELRRQLAARQRGGADASSVLVMFTMAAVLAALGAATGIGGRHHGVTFMLLGGLIVAVAVILAAIGLRLRKNLNALDATVQEPGDPDLDAVRADVKRLATDLGLDSTDPLELAAATEALQRELTRRQSIDAAKKEHDRLAIELDAAKSHRDALLAAVGQLDQRAAKASLSLGFASPLGIEGLDQAVTAILQAHDLTERIMRIRRADDALVPSLDGFSSLLSATEAALELRPDDEDVTRRVRLLEEDLQNATDDAAARAQLSGAIAEATERLVEALGEDVRAGRLQSELSSGEVAAWEIERRDTEQTLRASTESFEAALGELRDAERELDDVRGSSEVMRLGLERAAASEELDDVLEQWLVAGAAKALLERCLARYEIDRQPKVISYAAELFSEVTDGRYSHLVIDEEDDGARRHVVAITPGGERVDSGDLSRGTAEQLYLCLRLGFAASFAEQSVSLPLVVDDILVNFDPRRAAAVARIFGRVAKDHQVIAFTCHPHVVELFRDAVPEMCAISLG